MGLTETLHYLILTWPLVLCTVFCIFPLYSVVLNIFVFLILTHMLLSTCSYFTPYWEIWDHLKGRIFHFLHFGFSEFFIHFFHLVFKGKANLIPFLKLNRSRAELYFRNTCHWFFSGLILFPWCLVNACLSLSVQGSCHFCNWLFTCPSLIPFLEGGCDLFFVMPQSLNVVPRTLNTT